MSNSTVNIGAVKNTGLNDLSITFSLNGGEYSLLIPPGIQVDTISVPLEGPGSAVINQLFVSLAKGVPNSREVRYYFNEVNGQNEFYYIVPGGRPDSFKLADGKATTPGKEIVLSVNYEGDGTVIVGTGDL